MLSPILSGTRKRAWNVNVSVGAKEKLTGTTIGKHVIDALYVSINLESIELNVRLEFEHCVK